MLFARGEGRTNVTEPPAITLTVTAVVGPAMASFQHLGAQALSAQGLLGLFSEVDYPLRALERWSDKKKKIGIPSDFALS